MLLGLIPSGLETGCEVKHRVLEDSGWTDRILLTGALVGVVEGRKAVAVVDGRMSGQRHLGGQPGGQTGPDTHEAPPHMRVHCPSHTPPQVVVHPAYHT